jgi:DNA-directed RNA polymerase subunit alpha
MIDTSHFHLKTIKSTATYGQFEMTPLFGGFGHTLGNALRRVLLITVPGAAITRIKIAGASHLFTTLPGIKEDLVEVSLNLKKIKFTYNQEDPVILTLEKKSKGIVTAGDIADSVTCKVANPDQVIATITDNKAKLNIELQVERGVGYTMAKEQKTDIVGEIILDATFTPVLKANYTVQPTRLGKKSNYDKLVMDIWTDGSVTPESALKFAAKDLINSLNQIFDTQEFSDEVITIASNPGNQLADISVEEIELPLRVTNALKKAGYSNIESLTHAGRLEVSKSKNVGEKSLKVIDNWLKEKGYSWSK